ncbi:hypothetical protein F4679DRAFT_597837 [Xylaria curta]|nr:hypothetical protein F4679DRAFT_597837 [Xylaria curta]
MHNLRFNSPVKPFLFFPTLPTNQAYGCEICAYAVKAANKIRQHHRTAHPEDPAPNSLRFANVQVIQSGQQVRYIQVVHRTAISTESAGGLLARHLNDDLTNIAVNTITAPSRSEPNKWLKRLRFNVHLKEYNLAAMASLVIRNHSERLALVIRHLSAIAWRARNLLASTSLKRSQVLKQLNQRNQQLCRSPFENVLVSACAVLAIDPRDTSWRTALTYESTYFLAFIKIFILMVYLRATAAIDDQTNDRQQPTWTNLPLETTDPFSNKLDAITKIMQSVMYEARMTASRPPRVKWIKHGQLKLVSHGTVTSTAVLFKLMHCAINKALQALQVLLMQPSTGSHAGSYAKGPTYNAPVPSLANISNNRSNSILRHSFLEHSANQE